MLYVLNIREFLPCIGDNSRLPNNFTTPQYIIWSLNETWLVPTVTKDVKRLFAVFFSPDFLKKRWLRRKYISKEAIVVEPNVICSPELDHYIRLIKLMDDVV